MIRFLTEKRLQFTIPGRPICPAKSPKDPARRATWVGHNNKAYQMLTKLCAKAAMAEQGWEITDAPVYIVVTTFMGRGKKDTREEQEFVQEYDGIPANRRPSIRSVWAHIMPALKGVVFKKDVQIAGFLCVRKYCKHESEQRVEVLVGAPRSIKELVNDLRNS